MVQVMGSFARIADEGERDEVSGVHARSGIEGVPVPPATRPLPGVGVDAAHQGLRVQTALREGWVVVALTQAVPSMGLEAN